ncbi:MAG TPA: beta-ketoacyl synthase N-terminal-like domain-containing protein [Pyrinomonadaceae bacterium]|nr:beta-ketoacyl synthase N-terminal-like domain-containing protein [Pyrinomonadaceae bacterium]
MAGITNDNRADEIAVIGINGRFPKAANTGELWRNLVDGVEAISVFTDQELIAAGVDSTLLEQPNYIKARAVIEDYDLLDAAFFGLTPREAEIIDPQHRLFMECAWEILEMAGYNPDAYDGSIGVFCGASSNTYLLVNLLSNLDAIASVGAFQTAINSALDFIATRVSYKFNLRGPSLTVQTACSTSLVAVHLACQSLLNGECDMALAGGISISVPQKSGYTFEEGSILSPDGHCRPFDAKAQGTVPGSGAAVVLLKRMEDALADNDQIYAVIKGSAINNDGSQKIGYTAPSVAGQASVIADAMSVAGIGPETITYVEAHGTGTTLGDPIEVDALTQVFQSGTDKRGYCAIGSIKSNVGHLDAAAGTTGLIKAVLALKHKLLPPSFYYEAANPQIDFRNSPFYVNSRLTEWKENGESPRRAGVSSFGIGGTNAHVVLEEAPQIEASSPSQSPQLLVLSAKTSSALDQATENLAAHLRAHPQLDLSDVAYTLQVGRKAFEHRRILVAQTCEVAAAALDSREAGRVFTSRQESRARTVAFMFPGQGAQYVHMARGLYEEAEIFRQQLDLCCDISKPQLGFDLRQALYPRPVEQAHRWIDPFGAAELNENGTFEDAAARLLQQTFITGPAIFAVEYALAKQFMAWGIEPQAMIGHSIGEYVAACLAGVFELKDALMLVVARGKLMQTVAAGSMLAVHVKEQELEPLLGPDLSLAAVNSNSLCVVSGATQAVEPLQQRLSAQGITTQPLHTSHAFHSQMMDSILEEFVEQVRRVKLNPPRIPFVSNLTGGWITEAEATDPDYWTRHLRHTVRFAKGLRELFKNSGQVLLEVGPGQTLSSLANQAPEKKPEQLVLRSLRHPREQQADLPFLLGTVGQLWLAGIEVDWPKLHAPHRRRRILLPTYPFERQRYWIEARPQGAHRVAKSKQSTADFFYLPVWKQSPLLPMDQTEAVADENFCWLIFLDHGGFGKQIEARLERDGQRIVTVTRGDGWKVADENQYVINPRQRQDFDALMKDLKRRNLTPSRILHLWNVSSEDDTLPPDTSLSDDSFWSLLFVAQALGAYDFGGPISIEIVSNDMQSVTGDEKLRPEKATLLGPCRVIPQEYANLTCRSVDVVNGGERDSLVDRLLAEFSAPREQAICAYRGRQRWVQTFDEIHLDQKTSHESLLRGDGVYLITSAESRTGLVFAKFLGESVRARLVLVAPSSYPQRDRWPTWLEANTVESETRCFIETVQKLEAAGAETLVINADTSDEAQMKTAVAQSIETFGTLNGVLHTETVPGGGLIQLKTPKLASSVLRPKVQATLSLDAALRDLELDFFALFSSSAALTGGIGQVDYCAANAFLDAFAHYRSSRSHGLTVAIDWDPFKWEDWQGSQMSGAPDVQAQVKETLAAFGLTEQQSVEAFSRALSSGLSQLIVSRRDFQSILEQYRTLTVSGLMAQMGQSQPGGGAKHARPNLSTPYVAPRNDTEKAVAAIWQELFGLEEIGVHDEFFELGGSSLLAIQLITRLRNSFGEDVSMNSIFEQPTIAGLAEIVAGAHLKSEELAEVDRVYEELKDLSPEELNVLLAEDLGFPGGDDIDV